MKGHLIVCGLGNTGHRVVHLLRALGEQVTVITMPPREDWLRDAGDAGVRVLIGEGRDERQLVEAEIGEAAALLALTDTDVVNIEIALDAKRLRPGLPIVIRLFDQNLARRLEDSFDIQRALGVSALSAPAFAAAALGEQIIGSFVHDGALMVVGSLRVAAGSPIAGLGAGEIAARHGAALLATGDPADAPDGSALQAGARVIVATDKAGWDRLSTPPESAPPRAPVDAGPPARPRPRVLGTIGQIWRNAPRGLRWVFLALNALIALSVFVFRYGMKLSLVDAVYFLVTTVTTTGYGDITLRDAGVALKLYGCGVMVLGSATLAILYALLTNYVVAERFQSALGRQQVPEGGHVVVVGLGNVGYRVVGELQRARVPVVGVNLDPDAEFVAGLRAQCPVIVGDARLRGTLESAGAGRADAVIATTGNDAANLSVGLLAKQMNPRARAVVQLADADFAAKVQAGLCIDAAVGASRIAAPTFVAAALYPEVHVAGAFIADGTLLTLAERQAPAEWVGAAPSQVLGLHRVQIVMRRGAQESAYAIAGDDAPLSPGERVLVLLRRQLGTEGG